MMINPYHLISRSSGFAGWEYRESCMVRVLDSLAPFTTQSFIMEGVFKSYQSKYGMPLTALDSLL